MLIEEIVAARTLVAPSIIRGSFLATLFRRE